MVTSWKLSTHATERSLRGRIWSYANISSDSVAFLSRRCPWEGVLALSQGTAEAVSAQMLSDCSFALSLSLCLPLNHINVCGRWPWKQQP